MSEHDISQNAAGELAIGGYFGLERHQTRDGFLLGATRFQSGRAALQAFLLHRKPHRIWLPRYICPVVVESVRAVGVSISFYSLDSAMRVASSLGMGPKDTILLIDYFGVSGSALDEAITQFGADRVIIDASQALFRLKRTELAVFYSPRKFVGIPDGGLLITDVPISAPDRVDTGSADRMSHLLMRAAGLVREGYREFRMAEASLKGLPPMAMSSLTGQLLEEIDFEVVRRRRRANYVTLAEQVSELVEYTFPLDEAAVPLCFPVVGVDASQLRGKLAQRQIFTPRYWPGIESRNRLNGWERLLCDDTLYLPCDQRYERGDMLRLAAEFSEVVARSRTMRKEHCRA